MYNRFENATGLSGQFAESDFLFHPEQNSSAQVVGLNQALHERDLIDAHGKKEACELSQSFFAQIPASVEIVTPCPVAVGKQRLVLLDFARQAARHRPDRASI